MAQLNVEQGFLDTLRLSPRDAELLLDKLQARHEAYHATERRRHPRVFFTQMSGIKMEVIHPGGSRETYLVLPHDLSAGGMCILHGSYIHSGTQVALPLDDHNGYTRTLSGKIARCNHFQGMIHEVGIMFDETLQLSQFTGEGAGEGADAEGQCRKLGGQLLYVESSVDFRDLLRFRLASMGVEMMAASSGEEAIAMAQDLEFDAIVVNPFLPDASGFDVIRQIRDDKNQKPILLAVSEDDDEAELGSQAHDAGGNALFCVTGDSEQMLEQLSPHLPAGGNSSQDVIFSSHWEDNRMRPLIVAFTQRLGEKMTSLRQTPADEAATNLWQHTCRELKSAASGYGYPTIAKAMTDLIKIGPNDSEKTMHQISYVDSLSRLAIAAIS